MHRVITQSAQKQSLIVKNLNSAILIVISVNESILSSPDIF